MTPFKPLAMLSSQLLARKGTAVPAALGLQLDLMDQLAANPIAPRLELRVAPSRPSHDGARSGGDGKSTGAPPPKYDTGSSARSDGAKVSLRLDADRHRRLRLVALHQRSSGQRVLLDALDAYLEEFGAAAMDGTCTCLRSRLS